MRFRLPGCPRRSIGSMFLALLLGACSGPGGHRVGSVELNGVAAPVPRVYSGSSEEIKRYCAYQKETDPDIARGSRQYDRCVREENQSLNNRRRACANIKSAGTNNRLSSAERERCHRDYTEFAKQMDLLREFDAFVGARTGKDWMAYLERYEKPNAQGLAGEARKRASRACAAEAPASADKGERDRFVERFAALGNAECDGKLLAARRAIYRDEFSAARTVRDWHSFIDRYRADDYDRLMPQAEAALQEAYRSEERAAFEAARSWEDWSAFLDRYRNADVAQLVPQAEQRFGELRHARKQELDSLSLDVLEQRYRQEYAAMPKELANHAKQRLLTELPAQQTFDGYVRAFRLKKGFDYQTDITLLADAQHYARSPDELGMLERLTVEVMPNKARLVDTDFSFNAPRADLRQGSGGWFVDRNFSIPVAIGGILSVRPGARSPVKLKHGTYSAVVALELTVPRSFQRRSAWLGNSDSSNDLSVKKTVTVTLSPPHYKTQLAVDFGTGHLASFNRGAMGGFDYTEISGEPRVTVRIQSLALSE